MNFAQMCMNYIRRVIPEEILQRAFIDAHLQTHSQLPHSLDSLVINEVIRGQLFEDCNLVGGREIVVDIGMLPMQYLDNYSLSFHIPKSMTQGRSILRLLSISYGRSQANAYSPQLSPATNPSLTAAQQLMYSHAAIPVVATAYLRLIEDNVVLVQDSATLPIYSYLRCVIENEVDFGNISPAYYPTLYKMAEQACKALIWSRLVLKQERGFIYGGASLGEMKGIIDQYADANELYMELLETKWRKKAILNDPESKRRHIKSIMSSH